MMATLEGKNEQQKQKDNFSNHKKMKEKTTKQQIYQLEASCSLQWTWLLKQGGCKKATLYCSRTISQKYRVACQAGVLDSFLCRQDFNNDEYKTPLFYGLDDNYKSQRQRGRYEFELDLLLYQQQMGREMCTATACKSVTAQQCRKVNMPGCHPNNSQSLNKSA